MPKTKVKINVSMSRTFRVAQYESLRLEASTDMEFELDKPMPPRKIKEMESKLFKACRAAVFKEAAAQLGKNVVKKPKAYEAMDDN